MRLAISGVSTLPALTIVIPALNCASRLDRCLGVIAPATEGAGWPVVVADGGSNDDTAQTAERHGAHVISAPQGRGIQLGAGARTAIEELGSDWLLFLHADSIPEPGWAEILKAFMSEPGSRDRAGYGRFALDDPASAARRLESMVAWRCRRLGLPYGDQGLLIHRDLYLSVGGFPRLQLMEDVALVRWIGRRRLTGLPMTVTTSAERYQRDGYIRRPLRNLGCLGLYLIGVAPPVIRRLYG
ncbi:MAG TPA: glycosyltransferase [Skermanella sp.]|nr:glycosyltransferase [Skermanella sp.]